jgi:chaperonin cofactor prefoldin
MTEERLNRIEELILDLSDNMIGFRRTVEERFDHLEIRIKTIELDVEPDGRISEGFERLSQDIDSLEKRLERLEHGQNRIQASLDIILRHITFREAIVALI